MKHFFTAAYKKGFILFLAVLMAAPLGALSVMPKKAEASAGKCLSIFGIGVGQNAGDHGTAAATSVPVNVVSNLISQGIQNGSVYSNFWQDCIEHGLALAIGKMLLSQMTAQIVNWIDNGFDGNPAFVTNPGQFLTNIADGIAGEFILGTDLAFLCSPFKFKIQLQLALNYSYRSNSRGYQFKCTLSDIIKNIDGFFKDFDQGGWPAWIAMTQNDQNNPYGAYLKADQALSLKIGDAQAIELQKLNWGNGFLSWDTCTNQDGSSYTKYGGATVGGTEKAQDEGAFFGNGSNCTTKTPGSVIAGTLQNQLNIPAQQLGLADDLDKIANALLNQLIKQVMGGVGGLLGAGSRSSGGGRSFVDDLASSASANVDKARGDANGALGGAENPEGTGGDSNDTTTGGSTIPESVNIALQKDTQASSQGEDRSVTRLVDGDKTNGSDGYSTAPMSANQTNPWFQVDLGSNFYISKVNVYHSVHPTRNSTEGMSFKVQIFPSSDLKKNDLPIWEGVVHAQDFRTDVTEVVSKNGMPVYGQYVRIQGIGAGVLEAAELEVYHRNPPTITLKKGNKITVNQGDSFVDPGFTASDSKDGNLTDKVKVVPTTISTNRTGVYAIDYSVTNSSGLTTTVTREVTVQ